MLEAQRLLNTYFGEHVVAPNGRLNKDTQRFVGRFQRAERLIGQAGVHEGHLDDATLQALRQRAAQGVRARVQRVDPRNGVIQPPQPPSSRPAPPRPATPGAAPSPPAAPQAAPAQRYMVRAGDTLADIARQHGVTPAQLEAANPGINSADLRPGDSLRLPENARATPTPALPVRPPQSEHGPWQAPTDRKLERTSNRTPDPHVEAMQSRLRALGYELEPDGRFGTKTLEAVRAFQAANQLEPDGIVGRRTWEKLQAADARGADAISTPGDYPRMAVYPPGSPQQIALFREAARLDGFPLSWATSNGLQRLLASESQGGVVGIPNYTYGRRIQRDPSRWARVHADLRNGRIRARSSATGLGQLLLSNVDKYYPDGRRGIGDPMNEARGMLRYIARNYRNPDNAWRLYNTRHEGY